MAKEEAGVAQAVEVPAQVTLAGAVLQHYRTQKDKSGLKLRVMMLAAEEQATSESFALTAKEVAERLHVSEKSAIRGLHELRVAHLLIVVEQGGHGKPSRYRLATAQDVAQLPARGGKGMRTATRKSSSSEPAACKRQTKKGVQTASSQADAVWTAWSAANVGAGRHVPLRTNTDVASAGTIGEWVGGGQVTLEELRRLLGAFLADQESELLREGHPLHLLPERISRYVNRATEPSSTTKVEAAPEAVPVVAAEV